ncbi:molybdenum cofactor guanylyltransferase [Bacillus rubiinfantis]|uniref:molybdenum cofactor guanylyltransferase n=1 Tax=Bacillus rubiinfantis TaxID=1499680 RepID=UPI0005AA3AD8|nr:molybdenum cofactor guanylyltransferase [Bacillus rubiinfantis]
MSRTAIILSGGKSSRMGTNKSLLKINNKSNIEIIIAKLKQGFDDIILVTNEPETYEFLGVKMVTDQYPGMGPLAGLHAGLQASHDEVNLLAACDMPFISVEAAEVLIRHLGNAHVAIPVINGKQHPLFAVYKKDLAAIAAKCIEAGRLRMQDLQAQTTVQYVTEQQFSEFAEAEISRIFFNMNHPKEYETAKQWAES